MESSNLAYTRTRSAPNSLYKSNPCPFDGGIIGINFAGVLPCTAPLLIDPKSTTPYVYPLPPFETVHLVILLPETSTTTFPPVPSPNISNSPPVVVPVGQSFSDAFIGLNNQRAESTSGDRSLAKILEQYGPRKKSKKSKKTRRGRRRH